MTRAATGHRWPLVVALLAVVLALGAAAPERASAAADLVLTATDTPDPATPNDIITVSGSVKNVGNQTAYDVQVGFTTITNATVANAGGCQTFLGVPFASCGVGTLAPGQTKVTSIGLRVRDDVPAEEVSLYVNSTADDMAGNQLVDPTPADNQAEVRTKIEPRADLKLELSAITPVTIGNNSTITATVANQAPGPARETKFQLTVPPDRPVGGVPEGCTTPSSLKVICDLGTIEGQGIATRAITVGVPSEGASILLGSVAWVKEDPTPGDALSQVTVTGLSPIEPTDPGPPPTEKPALAAPQKVPITLFTRDVPSGKRCIRSKTLRFRLKRPSGVRLTQADVYLGTRRVARLKGAALTKPVVVRGLPKGRYTLIVVASLQDGGRLSGRRVLKACR